MKNEKVKKKPFDDIVIELLALDKFPNTTALGAEIEVSSRTIENWREGEIRPGWLNGKALIRCAIRNRIKVTL